MSDDLSKVDWEVPLNHEAPSDDIAKRMEALVREVAQCRFAEDESRGFGVGSIPILEARAIVALLPEPVDGDLLEVRRIVADALPHGMRADILSGAQDHTASIQAPLACLKAGRALEKRGHLLITGGVCSRDRRSARLIGDLATAIILASNAGKRLAKLVGLLFGRGNSDDLLASHLARAPHAGGLLQLEQLG